MFDCFGILELFDLLKLPYPLYYLVFCPLLYLFIATGCHYMFKILLSLFDLVHNRVEQIFELLILFLYCLGTSHQEVVRGLSVFFFIVLQGSLCNCHIPALSLDRVNLW